MVASLPAEDNILYKPTAAAKESTPSTTEGIIPTLRAVVNISLIFVSKSNSGIYIARILGYSPKKNTLFFATGDCTTHNLYSQKGVKGGEMAKNEDLTNFHPHTDGDILKVWL